MKNSLQQLQKSYKKLVLASLNYTTMNIKDFKNTSRAFLNNLLKSFETESEISKQSPVWMQSTLIGLMASASFGVIWLSIAKTDEIVTVTGKLEPKGSVQEIQMPLGGIASEILVKEGDSVLAGQVVMRLDEATQKRFES